MPPRVGAQRRGDRQTRSGPARGRGLQPSGRGRRRPLSPLVPRRGPAADNALPGATSRAAARQTPSWRPPPRAGPCAPSRAPPGFPLSCQGRRWRSAPAPPRSALPAPPRLLPRSSRGPPRPLFGFTAPNFCLAPHWFFPLAQSKGRAPRAPASCYSRPRRQGRGGTRPLGSPENFLKLDRVAAHSLNPFPPRPLFASTHVDFAFSHLAKQGTARVFRDHVCGLGFFGSAWHSCAGNNTRAQCNVVLKLSHSQFCCGFILFYFIFTKGI